MPAAYNKFFPLAIKTFGTLGGKAAAFSSVKGYNCCYHKRVCGKNTPGKNASENDIPRKNKPSKNIKRFQKKYPHITQWKKYPQKTVRNILIIRVGKNIPGKNIAGCRQKYIEKNDFLP